jgi:transcriptional regulator with XRE-family HTH domain
MDIGTQLRMARNRWGLTLREVEERTGALAQEQGNPAYRISASWLDRIERENRELSATKLVVLAYILGLTTNQILSFFPKGTGSSAHLEHISSPNSPHLLQQSPLDRHAEHWLPDKLITDPPPEDTTLLPSDLTVMPAHYRRGIIGRHDRTMEPMILPGAIVLIDTQKRAIANRRDWTNEFNRPIYFLLTRTSYIYGFCDLDKEGQWLTLVPHMLSFETNKRWRYRKEVEVVGTVSGVFSKRLA